jgi:integrase
MRPAAGTAGVGNGRPSLQTWIAHSEISVLPVPPAGSGDHRSRVGDERIAGRVEQSLQCFAKFWRSRILKRAKLWARVADDIRPLKEPATIGRALTEEDRQRLLKAAVMHPEGETAHLAAILCLNTTAKGCELKALQWSDVDLFARTLTIRTSKTAAGERVVPLTDVLFRRWRSCVGEQNLSAPPSHRITSLRLSCRNSRLAARRSSTTKSQRSTRLLTSKAGGRLGAP